LNNNVTVEPGLSAEEVDKLVCSSKEPTTTEIKKIFDYANYLVLKSIDVDRLETIVTWLYNTYGSFNMDKTPLIALSKSVAILRAKVEPTLFVVQDEVDYKELSKSLRSYVFPDSKVVNSEGKDKDYKADVTFLLPMALQRLADNINARFKKGITDPMELVTKQESSAFTSALVLMTNELYSSIDAGIKTTDEQKKIPARLFAVKDLAEILKARTTFNSSKYFWNYTRAAYLIDEATTKAEDKGLVDADMLDVYNKDYDLEIRIERLKSESKMCY